jgi:hypothetical protein
MIEPVYVLYEQYRSAKTRCGLDSRIYGTLARIAFIEILLETLKSTYLNSAQCNVLIKDVDACLRWDGKTLKDHCDHAFLEVLVE